MSRGGGAVRYEYDGRVTARVRYRSRLGVLSIEAGGPRASSASPSRTGARSRAGVSARARAHLDAAVEALDAYFAGRAPRLPVLDLRGTHVPARGLGGAPRHPVGRGPHLRRGRAPPRPRRGRPRGRRREPREPHRDPVPCHRVVQAGGTARRLRGGLDVKRWLLAHEAAHAPPCAGPDEPAVASRSESPSRAPAAARTIASLPRSGPVRSIDPIPAVLEVSMAKLLAMILAGGEGRRLDPLTRERAKPAVPFGGRYRIIDFVLSNFANSGILKMKVLVQYKSESLNAHIQRGWRLTALLDQYVEIVPAQMRVGPKWFEGSADAIYQNLNIITDEEPELHLRLRRRPRLPDGRAADARLPPRRARPTSRSRPSRSRSSEASEFGIIEVDAEGRMIGFVEKPKSDAKTMPGDSDALPRVDGELPLHDRRARAGDRARRRGPEERARLRQVDRRVDVRARSASSSTTSRRTSCPARARRSAATGATSGPSTPTSRRTWTSSRSTRSSPSTTTAGPSTRSSNNYPPAKFVFNNDAGEPRRARHRLARLGGLHHLRRPRPPLDPLAQGAGELLRLRRGLRSSSRT